jgi:hypothetical protein
VGVVDFALAVASVLSQLTILSLFRCVLRFSSVRSVLNLLIFLCVLSLSAVHAITVATREGAFQFGTHLASLISLAAFSPSAPPQYGDVPHNFHPLFSR